ncbi:hypothetical protein PHLGIDRAFT_478673 [Phlebiopsis gigantea 11061_1 CR5-6]|uniref:Uncharacterized protein n=1 Tax=Phlebiopsis gigantea (strain 11061_1 CR5-6) TaxID=745531 RepID=A0A0C3NLS7_PHLG1|nr:hypothetical protein PHLGIDRAFT_478673 [Phlebiopsis gigantea 11061_1 CR5-6]
MWLYAAPKFLTKDMYGRIYRLVAWFVFWMLSALTAFSRSRLSNLGNAWPSM